MNAHKELALRALANLRGDDTARARNAFKRCTQEEMGQQYGASGKTRAEILAEYEEHDAKVDAAIAWVKAGAGSSPSPLFGLRDTRIEYAGVLRCCLGTVAEEYEGKNGEPDRKVSIGMKSRCRHCSQPFTLIEGVPYPRWTPDWQIGGANDQV